MLHSPTRSEPRRDREPVGIVPPRRDVWLECVLSALRRLDALLAHAVAKTAELSGKQMPDPFQGLHITLLEVNALLARTPGDPIFSSDSSIEAAGNNDRSLTSLLSSEFGLSNFDIDVLLLSLAPELDLRYERIYAYIQNDVTRRRPTVDLALNLFCRSAAEKVERRSHFSPNAPLIRQGVVRLCAEPRETSPPLLAHELKVDDQVIGWLLGQKAIDARLISFAQIVSDPIGLEDLPLATATRAALGSLVSDALATGQPLRLYLHGPQGSGEQLVAEAAARESSSPLLVVDVPRLLAKAQDSEQAFVLVFREARFADAVLYFHGMDALLGHDHRLLCVAVLNLLVEHNGITLLSGREPWRASRDHCGRKAAGIVSIALTIPHAAHRLLLWKNALAPWGMTFSSDELNAVASRFELGAAQIAEAAAALARGRSSCRSTAAGDPGRPTLQDLFHTARQQSVSTLAALVRRIEPRKTLSDIVLPPDCLVQLKEVCDQVRFRSLVYGEWGFDRQMSLGKDLTVLFSGASGTGKTMAAEAIAAELGLDLYKIDLARVVSKYIGETEKNLDLIFTAAVGSNAILFFDEADALFGKRSQVRDAHDRYANIEIAYLLQKMEEHEGLTILATNIRTNMDDAFIRRLKFHVEFPFPDEACRYRIWCQHVPSTTPCGDDIDFRFLARQFSLAGGNIRNIVVNASFLAASDGPVVRMQHLVRATKRELQKMGRTCSEAEFGPYFPLVEIR